MNIDIPMILPKGSHNPAEVLLVGAYISKDNVKTGALVEVNIGSKTLLIKLGVQAKSHQTQMALIYAYIYESHVYHLPKPKIMVVKGEGVEVPGQTHKKNDDGGKKKKDDNDPLLHYWRMHKLDRASEIAVEEGFIQDLVLDANMPGKRSPNTYAANMQMGHRSGRLQG